MRLRAVLVAGLAWAAVSAAPGAFVLSSSGEEEPDRGEELRSLMAMADALMAGQAVGGGLALGWAPHLLKGEEGQTYVPFSLEIDEHSRQPAGFLVYVRAVPAGRVPPPGEGQPGGIDLATADLAPGELPVGGVASQHTRSSRYGEASARLGLVDKEREAARGPYVFEESYVVEVDPDDDLRPYRVARALLVPPGDYVVYLGVAEVGGSPATARSAVVRQPLQARNFWGAGLSLSSLILAERVQALGAPMSAGLQSRRPYAVGAVEIVPVAGRELGRDQEPSVAFQVYGAAPGPERRPKVGIEYLLKRLDGEAYVAHARLPAQQLDARTLPRSFDPDAGHQLGSVQELPVALLPPGEYLLEVTVTDQVRNTSVRGALDFAVREP